MLSVGVLSLVFTPTHPITYHNQPQFYFHCRFHWSYGSERAMGNRILWWTIFPLASVESLDRRAADKETYFSRTKLISTETILYHSTSSHSCTNESPWWKCFSASLWRLSWKLFSFTEKKEKLHKVAWCLYHSNDLQRILGFQINLALRNEKLSQTRKM